MPTKAKGKKGGKPVKQPKRPAPPPSSSDDEDDEMTLIRGLIGRMDALEKARGAPSDSGAGPSGGGGVPPPKAPRRTRGATRSQLLKSISARLDALESGGAPAGPVPPSGPDDLPSPVGIVPAGPAPVAPLPLPVDPAPVLPSPLLPSPAAPVDSSPVDPQVPAVPGAGGAAAPVQVLICGHSLVFWAFKRASTSHWGSQLGFG
ncbi:basic proline-rich protein-like [Hemicordylus capensis]|uniref:basic proline-rich protein-like n=1 Tax=Hemicordylus capensis TaxID=884348 RepID=UPI002302C6E6|nr:basic proline-rich protein-like [Hemicordylus capensis]